MDKELKQQLLDAKKLEENDIRFDKNIPAKEKVRLIKKSNEDWDRYIAETERRIKAKNENK